MIDRNEIFLNKKLQNLRLLCQRMTAQDRNQRPNGDKILETKKELSQTIFTEKKFYAKNALFFVSIAPETISESLIYFSVAFNSLSDISRSLTFE